MLKCNKDKNKPIAEGEGDIVETFIHGFMECDGIPMRHTSKECMTYLQNILG